MDIKSLKRDVAASTEGAWVGEIPEMGDLRLRVRGENSPKVAALQARKMRAVPKDRDSSCERWTRGGGAGRTAWNHGVRLAQPRIRGKDHGQRNCSGDH